MKFDELEKLMEQHGVATLADIARILSTTPQAVSNWKSRDQVPYHVIAKINQMTSNDDKSLPQQSQFIFESGNAITLNDIFVILAQQLKVIFLLPFITVFFTFTYVQFIKQPLYQSSASILLPDNQGGGNLGGLAGLASQFGVNIPTGSQADLSSPTLFPELLRSRTFAEKIIYKEFYTNRYKKKLPLLSILTHGDEPTKLGREELIVKAIKELYGEMLVYEQDFKSSFSIIKITAPEPVFAKELAEVIILELEKLNRYFKSQNVSEKINFIDNRIISVQGDLEKSEQRLKAFNEQNRQISSPALQLEQEYMMREVEIQKGVYLTLKQQLELAKIEEVQQTTIVQILDRPQVPLSPSNIQLIRNVFISGLLGIGLGILLAFFRTFVNNADVEERKKQRRVKNFVKKKGKDLLLDRRISGTVSILLFIGLPFYLTHQSKNPVFFGMYSAKFMLVNTIYVLILLLSFCLFVYMGRKKK